MKKKEAVHSGDYNLDLLKHNSHSPTNEFIDLNFAHSYIPLISKPTRVTSTTATLIDNIFTNIIHKSSITNGIIITDISDHFPVIYIKHADNNPEKQTEFKLKRVINETTRKAFKNDISNADWTKILEDKNPQTSYTTFHSQISKIFEKKISSEKGKNRLSE